MLLPARAKASPSGRKWLRVSSLEAVLCVRACRSGTLSGRLRAQRVPVGEGRAAVADSGRARAKTGSVSMCIVFPVCDHPILSLVS
jgi:hypothetical protein